MAEFTNFITSLTNYTGIFLLMFSTFLIGYFSAWWFQKTSYRGLISRLKKEVNESIVQKNINDIETIFTEIKPKIIEVVKSTQKEIDLTASSKKTAEKARSSFVNYSRSRPQLNFESFGYADKKNRDDLTKIKGVGPYIEQKLNEIGIYNYEQIRRLKESDIRVITDLIDFFPGRIERDDWVGQAESFNEK